MLFIRRWFWLGVIIFSLGGWAAKLQADINSKASKDDYTNIRHDIADIHNDIAILQSTVNAIAQRQQQFYCENKPAWCR